MGEVSQPRLLSELLSAPEGGVRSRRVGLPDHCRPAGAPPSPARAYACVRRAGGTPWSRKESRDSSVTSQREISKPFADRFTEQTWGLGEARGRRRRGWSKLA